MTLDEIKQAVNDGKIVHWKNNGYRVIKTHNDQWLIEWVHGRRSYIGLTWKDGITLNGRESDFYLAPSVL